jgi:predicted NBD/HSP70 family sugar kinase
VSGPSIARRAAEALAAEARTAEARTAEARATQALTSQALTADRGGSRLRDIPLDELTAVDVYAAAAAGDALATDLVEQVGRQLAWAIHLLVLAYDVDRVVLGGGVSHAGETFMAPIRRELDRLRAASPIAGELLPVDVVEPLPVGADAGVLGAVAIAQQALQGDGWADGSTPAAHDRHAPTREEVRHA